MINIFDSINRFKQIIDYPYKVGHEYPLSRSKRLGGFGFVQE
jgi:hypothetical protein